MARQTNDLNTCYLISASKRPDASEGEMPFPGIGDRSGPRRCFAAKMILNQNLRILIFFCFFFLKATDLSLFVAGKADKGLKRKNAYER